MGRPKGCTWVRRCTVADLHKRAVLICWYPSRWHAYTLHTEGTPVSTVHGSFDEALAACGLMDVRLGNQRMSGRHLMDALQAHGMVWRCLPVAKRGMFDA